MSSMEDMTIMPRIRRKFTVEFKRNAVTLVDEEHRPISHVAHDLNISPKTLATWIRQKQEGKLEGKIAAGVNEEAMRMSDLLAENQQLKAEILLLKNSRRIFPATGSGEIRFYR